jgi:trigger factor
MRAPVYEEKVCELIFGQAEVKDAPISKEELLKDDEEG